MRFLSFKALLVLVVLPPIVYVAALQGMERVLARHYLVEIEKQVPGDPQALLAGRMRLADHVEGAVSDLLADAIFRNHGVALTVMIRTRAGHWLYPPAYRETFDTTSGSDPIRIASDNFALLNEGLDVSLDVKIGHNTLVANCLLGASILMALAGLAAVYRRGARQYAAEEARRESEQDHLRAREQQQKAALEALEEQRDDLTGEIETIQGELKAVREKADRNEADLFDEVEALEQKLKYNLSQQDRQQGRIRELEDQLAQLAKEREALSQQQNKATGGLRKRLETLYKNTAFTHRALAGLAELPESMQIKAEEVIHQLNANADDVPIKRKLFRGKGKETVFEIVFARKGRLYFRRTKARKVDVLAVGTKNTQEKDLVYLDRRL